MTTEGGLGLYVNGYKVTVNPESFAREFVIDPESRIPVGFFVKGTPYKMWGLIPWDRHLIGPLEAGEPMFLWGADRLGRDVLSRTIHGTRISMTVGLVGVTLSLVFGILLGGVSGYYGGRIDNVIQRVIEFLLAIPTIPLWMGLAAAIPPTLSPVQVYFMITIILSLVGWTGLARVVRGRFLALKNEDFVTAARLDGGSELGIILRHMVAVLRQPHHRRRDPRDPGNGAVRDRALLPRHRPPTAGRLLGRAAAGGAEHPLGRDRALAAAARRRRHRDGARPQLPRRRPARRRRPYSD